MMLFRRRIAALLVLAAGAFLSSAYAQDLTVSKSHAGSFLQGQVGATYTVSVSNTGGAPSAGAVTVSDTVPAGLTPTAAAGAGWVCSIVVQSVSCTRSDPLAAGASYPPITLTVNVSPAAPPSLTNTVTVAGGGDINSSNNSALDVTTIGAGPDLVLTKGHTGNFTQGQIGAAYTLTVSNTGGSPTSGLVTLTDTVPAGLTPTTASGTGWTCNIAGQTATCTRSDPLASGASYPVVTLTVNVAANAPASVTNTATVTGGSDVNAANNTATDPATVIPLLPDLTVAMPANGPFSQGQTGATYTITASNGGVGPTSGAVTVTDVLPPGLSATALAGAGWACTLATLTCTRSDPLSAGASYPSITLTVDIAANAPASVTNGAQVSGGGETNTANNLATVVTAVAVVPVSPASIPTLTEWALVGLSALLAMFGLARMRRRTA